MTKRKDRTASSRTATELSAASLDGDVGHDEEPSSSVRFDDKESRSSVSRSDGLVVLTGSRDRSESRDSVNDDPRSSFIDSISAASGRNNWSGSKDIADYDPSISSIKGDSVSATIADYNRKHHNRASSDNQSRNSGRVVNCGEPSTLSNATNRHDDASVNINFFNTGSISTAGVNQQIQNQNHHHRVRKHAKQRRSASRQHQYSASRQRSSSNQEQAAAIAAGVSSTAIDFDDLPPATVYQVEPIVIRGNGNLTLFGLSNSFNSEFPPALLGRVSREEFDRTMSHINQLLRDQQSFSAKLLLVGSLFCCCSMGFSLVWPSIILKRRCKTNLEKFLLNENNRLYSKLGLNWRLGQRNFNRFVEHVIIIEFSPKIDPYMPD